ncbi:protein WHAT'S THIS FACTOR 9, mitochondrial-like [Vigna umbellata]|uniref:protein WHAT'S THIS FACTOR 9, mitochondrial-like n=1 Tax=Vigna umbellata TaxID=87088 RepID=UPI001F5EF361|nr:protein WHAT'S THIS FACTOR 9, mitochondrial-like [Vigna umbellata]
MPQPSATRFLLLLSRRTPTRNRPPPPYQQRHHLRTIFDGIFKPVRDRGLDHAVEREKSLKPLISLKTLIKREPSKSLPLSLIKSTLHLPFRPIEFIRKYPSVFEEFLPTPTILQPHIRLTPEILHLDAEEQLVYQSHQFKHQSSDRLLKLLMIARIHKIPLPLIEHLRWDLGLPDDYTETVVPEFPDYFRVAGGFLELVCWSHELAVSVIQNRNKKDEFDGQLVFPVQFSTGFEMDKKYDGEDDEGSGEGSKDFSNWVYVIFLSAGYFPPFFLLA